MYFIISDFLFFFLLLMKICFLNFTLFLKMFTLKCIIDVRTAGAKCTICTQVLSAAPYWRLQDKCLPNTFLLLLRKTKNLIKEIRKKYRRDAFPHSWKVQH